jgi:uncharacterized protein YkwD
VRDHRVHHRFFAAVAVLALAFALSGCARIRARAAARTAPPRPPVQMPAVDSTAERQIIAAINSARAKAHVKAIPVHPALTNKARYWAKYMAGGGCGTANGVPKICHSDLTGGIHVAWAMLAENVGAASPRNNVIGVIQGFANSPPHAHNIVNGDVDFVGVGVAYSHNTVYVAQEFMAT